MNSTLEDYLARHRPFKCEICGGQVAYIGLGQYQCKQCSYINFDDYGKVRDFLDENNSAPSVVISEVTGVDKDIVDLMLEEGILEITENSKVYLKCSKCGDPIRYGRMCKKCAKELGTKIKNVAHYTAVEEKPKMPIDANMHGKMHIKSNW
jgi:ribosomal protein L32